MYQKPTKVVEDAGGVEEEKKEVELIIIKSRKT